MIPTTYKKIWAYLKAQSKAFDERLDKNINKRAKEFERLIKQVGHKVRLINPPQFKPKEWIINQK